MMDLETYITKMILEKKLATKKKLDDCQKEVSPDKSFVYVLEERKIVDEDVLMEILSDYHGIPSVNLLHYQIDGEVAEKLPYETAKKFQILPLFQIRDTILLVMSDPQNITIIDEIRIQTGFTIEPVISLPMILTNAIEGVYTTESSVSGVVETITEEMEQKDELSGLERLKEEKLGASAVDDEPIVKLVNLFIGQAIKQGASDLHFNPEERELRVRFRVDGILHEIATPPKKFQPAIISRIKVLAELDIAEKRRPQDGRIKIKVNKKKVDIRVSTYPTIFGENVVMRILDTSQLMLDLEELGFLENDLEIFQSAIRKPYGIILVTGPTGSGKTTTLYSALNMINSIDKNIITLEDPVEYNLKLIRQGQVNPKAGFTFANGLRSILRQDPDVIMVGEIRDGETAQIAVEAALTGHLVFSTIHTNDAAGTIIRLADMGIEQFLIASSMICVVAQRLLRRICEDCKEPYVPPEKSLKEIGMPFDLNLTFYQGVGCPNCLNTGYRGRVGIYEILQFTTKVRQSILRGDNSEQIKDVAQEEGMKFLREDGLEKVKMGLTSIEEVLRVTKEY